MNEAQLNYHHRMPEIKNTAQECQDWITLGSHSMSAFMLENCRPTEFWQYADMNWVESKVNEIFSDTDLCIDLEAARRPNANAYNQPGWVLAHILISLAKGERVSKSEAIQRLVGRYHEKKGDGVIIRVKKKPEYKAASYGKYNPRKKSVEE